MTELISDGIFNFKRRKVMKKIVSMAACLLIAVSAAVVYAQPPRQGKCGASWGDRMRAERIAFLTEAMDMTPELAEKFWPVYNEVQGQKRDAQMKVMETYRALEEAVRDEKPESDVSAALDEYLEALDARREANKAVVARLKTVLSDSELARYYVADERFRREQVHRLHHGPRPDADRGPFGRPGHGPEAK